MRVLGDIGVGHGKGIEGRDRVGDAVLRETLGQELRVAGAARLSDEAAAGAAWAARPRRGEAVRGDTGRREDADGGQELLRLRHGTTVMCLRAPFQVPKLGPCRPRTNTLV